MVVEEQLDMLDCPESLLGDGPSLVAAALCLGLLFLEDFFGETGFIGVIKLKVPSSGTWVSLIFGDFNIDFLGEIGGEEKSSTFPFSADLEDPGKERLGLHLD